MVTATSTYYATKDPGLVSRDRHATLIPVRRCSMRRSAVTLPGSPARNLLSEVMPLLSSPATLSTATAMKSAYTAMVR